MTILSALPHDYPFPLVIVQHQHATSTNSLARLLDGKCPLSVKEAEDKEPIRKGMVYLAPPNYHVLVEKDHCLALSVDEKTNYCRPSIDVLFESAARAYGAGLMGIVLTGSNSDGSRGLKQIQELGGLAVVQDPATAEYSAMPKAALDLVEADYVFELVELTNFLRCLSSQGYWCDVA
jgi:two-component system chemotaxis response regulator CheB